MTVFKSFTVLAEVCVLLCAGMQPQIGALSKNDTRLSDASDPKLHVGGLWEYKTRPGEETSRLFIVKIDRSAELGIIVHVAVDNLTWRDCRNKPFSQAVPHMPFARQALEASLSKQMGEVNVKDLPDYRAGYDNWKTAFSEKKAGVYVIPVRDAISVAEQTYRTGISCQSNTNPNPPTASR
jgi:hypothetical protein